MAQTIQLKRSALSGKVPGTGSLNLGELAVNTYDGKIFFKKSGSVESIQSVVTTNSITTGSIELVGALTASIAATNGVVSGSSQVISILTSLNSISASLISKTGSYATTSSNSFQSNQQITGSLGVSGDVTVLGSINAKQFNIGIISSSILYQSGSNKFGDTQDDTHQFTGSVSVTGSLLINGVAVSTGSSGTQGTYVFPNAFDFNVDDTTFGDFNSASLGYNLNFGTVQTVGSPIHFVGGLSNIGDTTVIYPTSRSIDFAVDNRYVVSISSQSFYTNNSLTASLQQGYTWVGNSSGESYAVATSSFGGALPSGVVSGSSQVVGILSSLNTYTSSNDTTNTAQNSRLTNLETTSASVNISVSNINTFTASNANTSLNTYTGSNDTTNTAQNNRLTNLETTSASVNISVSNINTSTSSFETKGRGIISSSAQLSGTTITNLTVTNLTTVDETASVIFSSGSNRFGDFGNDIHSFTGSVQISGSTTITGSLGVSGSITANIFIGTHSGSISATNGVVSGSTQVISILSSLNSFTASQYVSNSFFATTGSNLFRGNQTFSGSLIPDTTNAFDLGSATKIWRDLYISTGSIKFVAGTTVVKELTLTTLTSLESATGSTNSFTASILPRLTNLETTSASANSSISQINTFTSSNANTSLNSLTASIAPRLTNLETTSASVNISVSNINSFTSSNANTSLNAATASFAPRITNLETTSASVNISVSNINSFTSSNANTSLNSLTASIAPRLTNLETTSASVNISISNINTFTSSNDNTSLNATTASFAPRLTNLETTSASVNISVSNINSFTASNGNTSLNAATASFSPRINNLETTSASVNISISNLNSFSASNGNTSLNQFTASINGWSGSIATTGSNLFRGNQTITGSLLLSGSLSLTGSFSASLANGYTWVGGADNVTKLVATSSFGGATLPAGVVSGSSQITLSGTTGYGTILNQALLTSSTPTFSSVTGTIRATNGVVSGSGQIAIASTSGFGTYLNQAVLTTSSPTFTEIYADNWFRNNGSNEGLYNQVTTQHLSSQTNGYWDMSSTTSISSIRFYTGGHVSSLRGYVYANTSNEIGFLNSGGSWSLRCDNSGNVTATGDVTAYSDARVKSNVKTIYNALEKVTKLRGVSYNRNDTKDTSTKIGVIAQETINILPEVVSQDSDGMYNVSYGNMAGLFIEAIKEQQKQIEELKNKIQILENNLEK